MAPHEVVFLLDVDNTLLDNDAVIEDLKRHLIDVLGVESQEGVGTTFRVELPLGDRIQ